jgi:hypothetical protein
MVGAYESFSFQTIFITAGTTMENYLEVNKKKRRSH